MNTNEHDNPVDEDILEFEQRIISSMYEAEGETEGDTNVNEEFAVDHKNVNECNDVENLTINCDKVLLNKYLSEGNNFNANNNINFNNQSKYVNDNDYQDDINDDDGIMTFQEARYEHVINESDIVCDKQFAENLRKISNQFIDKDNNNNKQLKTQNDKLQKQNITKLTKNASNSQSTSTINKDRDENDSSNETKIIHYTRFETIPENKSQQIFVNLYHCRYDIIHEVCTEAPF